MPGRTVASSSGESPRSASVPGRYPCENTSVSRTSPSSVSLFRASRRSRCAESLPWPVSISCPGWLGRCAPVMRSTSAPCSASVRAQLGPASTRVRSSARTPDSGLLALRQRLRRAVANLVDLQQRQRRHRGGLRVLGPLRHRAHHAARALRRDDRLFQLEPLPPGHGLRDRRPVLLDAQHAQRRLAVVGEVAVQVAPATVRLSGTRPLPTTARRAPARRPTACTGCSVTTPSPVARPPRRPAAVPSAAPTAPTPPAPPPPPQPRRSPRCGRASAAPDPPRRRTPPRRRAPRSSPRS